MSSNSPQNELPSTPTSVGKSSNLFGKVLNKLRTPTSGGDGTHSGQQTNTTPRSFSPAMGRRSSSKSSMRIFGSNNGAAGNGPPLPLGTSVNSSTSSLALPANSSFDFDDDSLDLPQFESDKYATSTAPPPRSSSPFSRNLPSTFRRPSLSSVGGEQPRATADSRLPPRPSTSMSTRSRAGSVTDSASGSAGSGWKSALLGRSNGGHGSSSAQNSSERPSNSIGRSWSKSKELARSLGRPTAEPSTIDDAVFDGVAPKLPSRSPDAVPQPSRAPLTRQSSTEHTVTSSSHPSMVDDGTTPGLPRSGLSRSAAPSSQAPSTINAGASVGRKNWLASRGTAGVTGKARRVVQRPVETVPEPSMLTAEEPEPQPLPAQTRRTSLEHPPSADASPVTRPASSPNGHGRSRSELPPSSPKLVQSTERGAATLTLNSSSYLRKHGLDPMRPGSSLGHGLPEGLGERDRERLPSASSAATAAASATFTQMRATQAPSNSTAFRNRFLRGESSTSLSTSSQNSPDLPSFSSSASDPSPPLRTSTTSSTHPQPPRALPLQPRSVSASGPIKLNPMGPGLARKNSISLLNSLDERERAPPSMDPQRPESSTRAAVQLAQARASIEESRTHDSEEIVPYAARRTSISRDSNGHRYDQQSHQQGQDTASAHSSTLVGSTNTSLKRSNSETLMASSSSHSSTLPRQQPVARPGSSMSLYRDDPKQPPPASSRTAEPPFDSRYESPQLPPSSVPQPTSAQPLPSAQILRPYHDENVYDARPVPSSAPIHSHVAPHPPNQPSQYPPSSLPPHHPSQPSSTLPNGRQVLGEVNRGYPPSTVQQQQRGYGGKSSDFQVPLRDRSPGIAEATSSYTAQQHHYQSQQAFQQQQLQQQQQQQQYQQHPQQQQQPGGMMYPMQVPMSEQAHSEPIKRLPKHIMVNGKAYHRAGILGRGGSSKVYRVIAAHNNEICALKKVDTRNDAESRASFINEITLLKNLSGKPEIIQLIDAEVQSRYVYMVMEAGDTDLNSLLAGYSGLELSLNRVRYIWEQMLCAVQVIHEESIVHSDLKPANFVVVKGRVKLIDFGISKAIAADTTNIGRDQQIGTANYMPPEALLDTGLGDDGKRLMKLGRPADVWELGCILYQLVYGQQPFAHIRDLSSKILMIQNPLHRINYPAYSIPKGPRGEELTNLKTKVGPDLLETMKSCLRYNPKERATIPELLQQPFLRRSGDEEPPTSSGSVPPGSTTVNESEMAILTQRIAFMLGGQHAMDRLLKSPGENADLAKKLMGELRALKST